MAIDTDTTKSKPTIEEESDKRTLSSLGIQEKHDHNVSNPRQSSPLQFDRTNEPQTMSTTQQNFFIVFLTLSQLVQMIPIGGGINPALAISAQLGSHENLAVWIAALYPLTQGSFVLIGGQLGAMYGHKAIFTLGCVWWTFWALASRLCGIGGGLIVPNIVALQGITFPPGRRRNLSFALFGAMAPVRAAGGSLVAGVVVQLSHFKWLFFMLALLGLVIFGIAVLSVKADDPVAPDASVDWVGSVLGVGALILFNFSWNQAPLVGRSKLYEIVILVVSVLLFSAFSFRELKIAKYPILPFNIWKSPSFGKLILSIFFAFMNLGVFLWYMTIYLQVINGDSLILVGVKFLPLTIAGSANAFLAAWLVPRLPAQVIIGIGCVALIAINLLLALVPAHLTYWTMAFPALLLSAFTIDLIVTSAQIITSNNVARRYQGVAGSLIGTLLSYGMSTGLGFAATVEVHTNRGGQDIFHGYHPAAFLAVGFAGAALALASLIRIPKDTREGSAEDDKSGS